MYWNLDYANSPYPPKLCLFNEIKKARVSNVLLDILLVGLFCFAGPKKRNQF